MTGERTRLLIADDHPVVLGGLRHLLAGQTEFDVIAVCSDGESALNAIRDMKPDVALLDISMPGMTGLEILTAVNQEELPVRITILSAYLDDENVIAAVRGGAHGVMVKDAAPDDLLSCLREVAAGRKWLPSTLVEAAFEREGDRREQSALLDRTLTHREQEVVVLVSEGLPNREIGRRLNLTEGTVKVYLHKIYEKLGVINRTSLVRLVNGYRSGSSGRIDDA